MPGRTLGISAVMGSGAVALLWAALAAREEPQPGVIVSPSRPRKAESAPAKLETREALPERLEASGAAAVDRGDDYGIIRERIQKMEERLQSLGLRRNDLAAANQDLERQIVEKLAESSARVMAQWRVHALEEMLGLSAGQKQALTELWTKWLKQDTGRSSDRATWLSRETDVRSRLSAEQAAALHDSVSAQSRQIWTSMGATLGSMIGASRDDQARFQQFLGDYVASNTMLLPEGYGADWPGLLSQASGLLQPVLSADQRTRLDRFLQK